MLPLFPGTFPAMLASGGLMALRIRDGLDGRERSLASEGDCRDGASRDGGSSSSRDESSRLSSMPSREISLSLWGSSGLGLPLRYFSLLRETGVGAAAAASAPSLSFLSDMSMMSVAVAPSRSSGTVRSSISANGVCTSVGGPHFE